MSAGATSNPFPGLRSFEVDEDHLFFGRTKDVDELLRRLRTTRFLAVLGTSGSGKSSLVKSGLVPALLSGFMSGAGSSWRIEVMRPGDDPIGRLAELLASPRMLGPNDPAADRGTAAIRRGLLESTLRRGNLGLVQCVREARLEPHERLLIVVDQLEELFRFRRGPGRAGDEAVAFVQLLLAAARQERFPIYVVTTLRSEFLGHSTTLPGLAAAVNQGQYLVPRMRRDERRQAIVGPVAVGGGEIAERLVRRLLNDAGEEPDQLPILQHALRRAWDRWQDDGGDGPIDLGHYEAIGTLGQALDRHAEEAFAELTERQRPVAERLMKALTEKRPNEGHGTRRPCRLGEVARMAETEPAEVAAVVDVFRGGGRSFLMPPAGDALGPETVLDISHESLMRIWRRLARWVDEETEAAAFYARLADAARHHAEGQGALWRNPELELGLEWRQRHRPTAAWAERYDPRFERAVAFLDQSREAHQRELTEREAERRRKLRQARLLAAVSCVAAVLVLALGLVAFAQRNTARDQEAIAVDQRRQAEEAWAAADKARQEAVDALEAARQARGEAETQRDVAWAERQRAELQERVAQEERDAALSARRQAVEAQELADEAQREAERERDRKEEERAKAEAAEREALRLRRIAEARALATRTLGLREEGQRELAALLALQAYRLNLEAGGQAEDPEVYNALRLAHARLANEGDATVADHDAAVRGVAVTADGGVISGGEDGVLLLTDLTGGTPPKTRPRKTVATLGSEVKALASSAGRRGSGRHVAAATGDGALRVWDLAEPGTPRVFAAPGGVAVRALAFSPGGDLLAAGDAGGGVRIYSLQGEETSALPPGGPAVSSLAWSADGVTLIAGAGDAVRVWRPASPADAPRVLDAGGPVLAVARGGDGHLAAGTAGGKVVLWDGEEGAPVELVGHTARVVGLAFHPRRPLLASASFDGTVRLWDVKRPAAAPLVLAGHTSWVWTVAFSPDGAELVSGSSDGTVRRFQTRSAPLAAAICAAVSRDLSPDERLEYLPEGAAGASGCPPPEPPAKEDP